MRIKSGKPGMPRGSGFLSRVGWQHMVKLGHETRESSWSAVRAGGILRAGLTILILNLLSRLSGFVRDAAIAARFGASGATDAYLVAYTLPYALEAVVGMAFVNVMVPALSGYLSRGDREEAWRGASSVLLLSLLLLTLLSVAGVLVAPWLVNVLAPGFWPPTHALATHLTRIIFPSVVFAGTGMLVTGILNACRSFAVPASAPLLCNLIIIAFVLFSGGMGIDAVAWGTLAGFAGFALVQGFDLRRQGFRLYAAVDIQHPLAGRVFRALLPAVVAVSVNQLYLISNRFFGSALVEGSITAIDLAFRVISLPLGIVVGALATAVFPDMAEYASRKENSRFSELLELGLCWIMILIIPMAVGMAVLREPLVQILFERGEFGARGTGLTSTSVYYFCYGLFPLAVNMLFNRIAYARGDIWGPALGGLLSVVFNVCVSMVLVGPLGHGGLALANSLSAWLNAAFLLIRNRVALPGRRWYRIVSTFFRVTLAAVLMGLVVDAVMIFTGAVGLSVQNAVIVFSGAVLVGAASYLVFLLVLRVREAADFLARVFPSRRRKI